MFPAITVERLITSAIYDLIHGYIYVYSYYRTAASDYRLLPKRMYDSK